MNAENLKKIIEDAERYYYNFNYPDKYGCIYNKKEQCLKLNKSLRNNKDFMLSLIKELPENFLISSRKLKNDFDFVSQCIVSYPKGFYSVSDSMKSNMKIAQSAIEKYWPNYLVLPRSLLKSKELFLIALSCARQNNGLIELLVNKHDSDYDYLPKFPGPGDRGNMMEKNNKYYETIVDCVEKSIERDNLNIELTNLQTNKISYTKKKI